MLVASDAGTAGAMLRWQRLQADKVSASFIFARKKPCPHMIGMFAEAQNMDNSNVRISK